jgi:hypothetical protein
LIEAGGGAPDNGSILTIDGNVTGSGGLQVDTSMTLELAGSAAQQETVNWHGSGGTLQLDQAAQFAGTINDFAQYDVINIGTLVATKADFSGGSLNVTLSNGSSLVFSVTNTPRGETIMISNDGHNLVSAIGGPDAAGLRSSGFATNAEVSSVVGASLADWSHGLGTVAYGLWNSDFAGHYATSGVPTGEFVAAAVHEVSASADGHAGWIIGPHFF